MSLQVDIPLSTLAKVEQNRLTLSYDKLVMLASKLDMRLSDLLDLTQSSSATVSARRSIGSVDTALRVDTSNYDYSYLCTELRNKIMIPIITRVHSRSLEEFGDLVHHSGEEFIYVLSGAVEVHSQFYDPVRLNKDEYIYLDSEMGHAYILPEGVEEATLLGICAAKADNLQQELIQQARAEAHREGAPASPGRRPARDVKPAAPVARRGARSRKPG